MKTRFDIVRTNAQPDALVVHRTLVATESVWIRRFCIGRLSVQFKLDHGGAFSLDDCPDIERRGRHAWNVAHLDRHSTCEGENLLSGDTVNELQLFQNFGAAPQKHQIPLLDRRSRTGLGGLAHNFRACMGCLKVRKTGCKVASKIKPWNFQRFIQQA
jgi:hypothetical protein